jgi:hypothetical protein
MPKSLMVGCAVVAILAALFYILTGAGTIQPGELDTEDAPQAIAFVAGAGYFIGGLLILVKKRWLWITGAIINALVMAMFFSAYSSRPDVLLSVPGIGTKVPEVLLEIGLIYLVVKYKKERE